MHLLCGALLSDVTFRTVLLSNPRALSKSEISSLGDSPRRSRSSPSCFSAWIVSRHFEPPLRLTLIDFWTPYEVLVTADNLWSGRGMEQTAEADDIVVAALHSAKTTKFTSSTLELQQAAALPVKFTWVVFQFYSTRPRRSEWLFYQQREARVPGICCVGSSSKPRRESTFLTATQCRCEERIARQL